MQKPLNLPLIVLLIASTVFMEQLDATILTTALPSIAHTLNVSIVDTSATLTAYLIGLTIFIPASGPLADRLGSRTTLCMALFIFITASVACASAQSLSFLVAMRTLQGFGGALMFPVGKLIILRITPKDKLVSTMTWMMLPVALGPLLGPAAGGFITTYYSWRWDFYINIPFCLIIIPMIYKFVPEIRVKNAKSFNIKGFIITASGLTCIAISIELFSHNQASKLISLALFATGACCAGLYNCYTRNPFLDFTLLRLKIFRLAFIGAGASRIALGAFPFLLPLFLQSIAGLTPARSGIMISFAPIGAIAMTPFIPRLLRRFGFRYTLMLNGFSAAILGTLITFFHRGEALWGLMLIIFTAGVCQAVLFSAYNSIAYSDVPPQRISSATSFYSTMEQILVAFGISIAAGTLTFSSQFHHNTVPAAVDFAASFVIVGIVSSVAALAAFRLPHNTGLLLNKRDITK